MRGVLAEICATTRATVARARRERPLGEIETAARAASPVRGFIRALERKIAGGGYGLIAEIKKASPSRGLIRADFNPETLAGDYAAGGATCLSILTDEPYFQGHPQHLARARAAVRLPALRKDFLLEPYQIAEARALGADCVLLIIAALGDAEAAELEEVAQGFGMDVLVEVHDRAELDRALRLKTKLIGINNRDLSSLSIDLATTEELAKAVPADRMLVSESGLYTRADLDRMARVRARCFLVGESLMKQPDVAAATRTLLGEAG